MGQLCPIVQQGSPSSAAISSAVNPPYVREKILDNHHACRQVICVAAHGRFSSLSDMQVLRNQADYTTEPVSRKVAKRCLARAVEFVTYIVKDLKEYEL